MNKKHLLLIGLVCLVALILRIISLSIPMSPWWDPAIYVGMAKFFYSGGALGMWETLRPPLWPLIIGIPWLMGIPALVAAQWLAIVSSIATIFVLYIIGEKQGRGIGLAAAIILTLSPAFTYSVF